MVQMPQAGQMAGWTQDIPSGGSRAWRLPPDASCASFARSLLRAAMTMLRLGDDLVDAAVLAVSELATNAFDHGLRAGARDPIVPPELWMWARVTPAPQLVVAVFDTGRNAWPAPASGDLLAEQGRGLGIVGAVAGAWGAHLSRSRLCAGPGQRPGKAVWSAFPLPPSWAPVRPSVPSADVARILAGELAARGVENVRHRHDERVSLVRVPFPIGAVNVWVDGAGLSYHEPGGFRVNRPTVDFHDVAEHLIRQIEETC